MSREVSRVVVVGAGLAGLATAWRLQQRGLDVLLLERDERAGGRCTALRTEGFTLDPLASPVSETDRRLLAWVAELGLRDEWLPLRPLATAVVHRGEMRDTVLRSELDVLRLPGVRRYEALRLTRLPRLMTRYRPSLDPERPDRAARLDDRSLADFGGLYFGASVVDRWLAPRAMRGASGDAREMSRVQLLLELRRRGHRGSGLPRAALGDVVDRAAAATAPRLRTEVHSVARSARGLRVAWDAGSVECGAVVLACRARDAAAIAAPLLAAAERDHLRGVRYAPAVAIAAGLCRPHSPRPREIWVPRTEASPLDAVLLEPGLPAGRVPDGRGLAWARGSLEFAEAMAGAPTEAVEKELLDGLGRLLPGALRTVDFVRTFRLAEAVPRFDVGAYRALERFLRVQEDRRGGGRRLYFAGDHLVDPSWEGAVCSAERAARAVCADLGV